MNPAEFADKWGNSKLKERSGYQEHFIDLCHLVDHQTPAAVDPSGASFCFERGTQKIEGGQGWADVWKRGHFGWEYKGKKRDLGAAYRQLLQYREALENPPLLVVCDFERIVIHTNFTNTPSEIYELSLADLKTERGLKILRWLFHDPEKLRPGITSQSITASAAERIALIARRLRDRGEDPHAVARFLDRIVFCMFAEDIELLPKGLFTRILERSQSNPDRFKKLVHDLFGAMASGGDFGMDEIQHFNGSLFENADVLEVDEDDLAVLYEAAQLDWDAVDPSIFGTLFERGLDPDKRTQLGAHYTSREDIVALIEPVLMKPLRDEWEAVRATAEAALAKVATRWETGAKKLTEATIKKHQKAASTAVGRFLGRLTDIKILDPACGSGNFLYVSLQMLKDFEKEVLLWAMDQGLEAPLPLVHPRQLFGIELSPYAYDLAQMTVWIGHLQWVRANGFGSPPEPILQPLRDNFLNMDAIATGVDTGAATEPEWPEVDVIVGNPPFLGGKLLRSTLGDDYVAALFGLWKGRVPAEADLCCYWFEKARAMVETGRCKRAGLLATQGIRGGANREVLKRIKGSGEIFFAESDRPWVLDGAHVHISMVGFDGCAEEARVLDGVRVASINSNLTTATDVTLASRLAENLGVSFMGDTKGGSFDISEEVALELLASPNPHGKPNSDVVVPWVNGMDVTRRSRGMWIVDYGTDYEETEAARYEAPFRHVTENVKPARATNKREVYRRYYWRHVEARPAMRRALATCERYLVTPTVAKHRLFAWMAAPTLPDHQLIVFARSDAYIFGVLQSRIHEIWSRAQATQLREATSGTRYTPTSCFETFPFPWPLGAESREAPEVQAIEETAKRLDEMRARWLNPPEWTRDEVIQLPASADGPWREYVTVDDYGASRAVFTMKRPADAAAARSLKSRTLTALYNEMPQWLQDLHADLDHHVANAYIAAAGIDETSAKSGREAVLEWLLELNFARGHQ